MIYCSFAPAIRRAAAAALIWLAAFAAAPAQEPEGIVYIPDKTLGLAPPQGFELSKKFAGFIEPKSGSSFLLVELPAAAYDTMQKGLSEDALKRQKITQISRDTITIAERETIMIKGTQDAGGKTVNKWILIIRTEDKAMLLTAQDLTGDLLDDETVMAAFESIRIRPAPSLEARISGLPFEVTDLAGFRAVQTFADSGLLMTKGPKDVVDDGSQPILMIRRPIDRPLPTGVFPADLSDRLLRAVNAVEITSIGDTVERTVAGADGYETMATARDKTLNAEVVVGQWLRLHTGAQMHVVAIMPEEGYEALLPDLRRLVAALSLKAL